MDPVTPVLTGWKKNAELAEPCAGPANEGKNRAHKKEARVLV